MTESKFNLQEERVNVTVEDEYTKFYFMRTNQTHLIPIHVWEKMILYQPEVDRRVFSSFGEEEWRLDNTYGWIMYVSGFHLSEVPSGYRIYIACDGRNYFFTLVEWSMVKEAMLPRRIHKRKDFRLCTLIFADMVRDQLHELIPLRCSSCNKRNPLFNFHGCVMRRGAMQMSLLVEAIQLIDPVDFRQRIVCKGRELGIESGNAYLFYSALCSKYKFLVEKLVVEPDVFSMIE